MLNKHIFVNSVVQNERLFTKREIQQAKLAKDLVRKLGYPSIHDVIKMINQGIIINCPVTVQDIQRSIQVYGEDIASLKGKITDTAPTIVNTNTLFNNTLIPTNQSMHCDIVFIFEDPYLVSVATPLDLVMVSLRSHFNQRLISRSQCSWHVVIKSRQCCQMVKKVYQNWCHI